MPIKVAVWGTGNVGRPALRAILAHRDLELCAVIVSDPDKVGRDLAEFTAIRGTWAVVAQHEVVLGVDFDREIGRGVDRSDVGLVQQVPIHPNASIGQGDLAF